MVKYKVDHCPVRDLWAGRVLLVYSYVRAETVHVIEPFLAVYILPSLSAAPVPFLVIAGTGVVVSEAVPILSNRYSFL